MANLSAAYAEVHRKFTTQQESRNRLQQKLQKKRSRIQEIEDLVDPPEERKRRDKAFRVLMCERALERAQKKSDDE